MIPYGRQSINQQDVDSVIKVLRSPWLTQGPVVPSFEESLCSTVSAKHAVAVNSATSALHLACLALGLGPGDYLWTSPITFVASANCARYCGAFVDFVDIDPLTGLISLDSLEYKLREAERSGTLPKVIVPVHLAGTSCPMKEIHDLVRPYNIYIIEDASHAVGASYKDLPVGSCLYSDLTVFSFHPVKIITTCEGGAVVTNDSDLAHTISLLRSHGITKDVNHFLDKSPSPWHYEQQSLGFNYRLSDIHAALGLSQLTRLSSIVEERNRLLDYYKTAIEPLPASLLAIPQDCISSVHLAVIRLFDSNPTYHRHIFEGLRAAGIGVQLHYAPVHLQPYYQEYGFNLGDFPNSESYSNSAISLPLYPGLTREDQIYVIDIISQLLSDA